LKTTPNRSNRQIAETVKASHNTVGAIRTVLEGRGQIDHVEAHTDTKGRNQPARKPAQKKRPNIVKKEARTAATKDSGAPALAPHHVDPDELIAQFIAEVRSSSLDFARQIDAAYRARLIERLHDVIEEIEIEAGRWTKEAHQSETDAAEESVTT
jgi:hypothetical protein